MSENKSNRIEWPDSIKGMAIIIVVFGHTLTPEICMNSTILYSMYLFINAINMPIFFFISGFLNGIKEKITWCNLRKKILNLSKWYIGYSAFVYFVYAFCEYIPTLRPIYSILGKKHITITSFFMGVLYNKLNLDNHLWFLYVLIILNFIRYLVRKLKIKRKLDLIIALVSGVLSIILFHFYIIDELVWKIMFYYMYFVLGEHYTYLKNKNNDKNRSNKNTIVLFFIFTLFYLTVCRTLDGNKMRILYVSIRSIIGTLSIPLYFNLYSYIKLHHSRLNNIFINFGKNSVYTYIIHQPFIVPGAVKVISLITSNSIIQITVGFIIGMIVSILFANIMIIIKNKIIIYN